MRRLPALALTLAAGIATLTACGSDTDSAATATSSSPAVPTTATATAPASSPPSEEAPEVADEIEATEQEAEAEATGQSPLGSDACAFATEDSLMAALRSSPDFNRTANPTGFRRIQCSTPFALASTSGTPQSSGVLFKRTGDSWTVLDVGSAIQCAQYGVTKAQGPALEGCVV